MLNKQKIHWLNRVYRSHTILCLLLQNCYLLTKKVSNGGGANFKKAYNL